MEYNDVLKMVKQQNKDKSHKDCVQIAKDKYREFKEQAALQKEHDIPVSQAPPKPNSPAPKPVTAVRSEPEITPVKGRDPVIQPQVEYNDHEIPYSTLIAAEKRIRAIGPDRGTIVSIAREVIPSGELVKHGKDGINTIVTFEDAWGNKIPTEGYFKIWI